MNREVCGICWCPYDDNGACGCQTLDDALRITRAMSQAYENGYKVGAAAEREACAKVCEDIEEAYQRQESMRHPALRTDAETGSGECAAAIRARSKE